jgi:hypothetical protein
MEDHEHEIETLRQEWLAFFDQMAARFRRIGAYEALTKVMMNARDEIGVATPASQRTAPLALKEVAALDRPKRERAPAGTVMESVKKVLARSIVPLGVQDIIRDAAEFFDEKLKDPSVRMACSKLAEKGLIQKNRSGQWHLTRRDEAVADQNAAQPESAPIRRVRLQDVGDMGDADHAA